MRVTITQLDEPPAIPAFVVNGVVAAPGGQTGATLLRGVANIVTVGAVGNGVKVNAASGSGRQEVLNRCGFDLLVYPTEGTAFEGYGANVPVTVPGLPAVGNATFTFDGVSVWRIT
jgi:hypothetical protein